MVTTAGCAFFTNSENDGSTDAAAEAPAVTGAIAGASANSAADKISAARKDFAFIG